MIKNAFYLKYGLFLINIFLFESKFEETEHLLKNEIKKLKKIW